MNTESYTIELHDVTPSRATVSRVLDGDVRAGSRYYATVDADMLPDVGERVWVKRSTLDSRGRVEITGRQK